MREPDGPTLAEIGGAVWELSGLLDQAVNFLMDLSALRVVTPVADLERLQVLVDGLDEALARLRRREAELARRPRRKRGACPRGRCRLS